MGRDFGLTFRLFGRTARGCSGVAVAVDLSSFTSTSQLLANVDELSQVVLDSIDTGGKPPLTQGFHCDYIVIS